MAVTRRGLLTGLGAFLAAPAIVRASNLMPVKDWLPRIIGDGIHDDWEGLQAALNGEPFQAIGPIFSDAGGVHLNGGVYLVTRPLVFGKRQVDWANSVIQFREVASAGLDMRNISPAYPIRMSNCLIRNCGSTLVTGQSLVMAGYHA